MIWIKSIDKLPTFRPYDGKDLRAGIEVTAPVEIYHKDDNKVYVAFGFKLNGYMFWQLLYNNKKILIVDDIVTHWKYLTLSEVPKKEYIK